MDGKWTDPGYARGANHGKHGARAYNGGLSRSPDRGQGSEPLLGVSGAKPPLKLKAFCPFSYKRGAKRRI